MGGTGHGLGSLDNDLLNGINLLVFVIDDSLLDDDGGLGLHGLVDVDSSTS